MVEDWKPLPRWPGDPSNDKPRDCQYRGECQGVAGERPSAAVGSRWDQPERDQRTAGRTLVSGVSPASVLACGKNKKRFRRRAHDLRRVIEQEPPMGHF